LELQNNKYYIGWDFHKNYLHIIDQKHPKQTKVLIYINIHKNHSMSPKDIRSIKHNIKIILETLNFIVANRVKESSNNIDTSIRYRTLFDN